MRIRVEKFNIITNYLTAIISLFAIFLKPISTTFFIKINLIGMLTLMGSFADDCEGDALDA